MDRFLTLLGLARRAGKLAMGETQVYEALQDGTARCVLVAEDAAPNTRDKLKTKAGAVPLQSIPYSKGDVGQALGRTTCAIVAVTEDGFAKSLLGYGNDLASHHNGGASI